MLALVGGQHRALELLPLVRMGRPVPGEDACYFYSKCKGGTAHYVSYHQDGVPEDESEDALGFLERWNQDSDDGEPEKDG